MSSTTTPVAAADDSFVPGTEAFAGRLRSAQQCVRTLLLGLGEDPEREGLRDTPKVRRDWTCGSSGARASVDRGRARDANPLSRILQHPNRPPAHTPPPPRPIHTLQRVAKAFLDMTQGYRQDRVR